MTEKRVVLVDDHEVVRNGLRMLVSEQFGYEVVEVGNAKDALQWAKDPTTDLVLLDVRLGEPDGLWVLDEIRKARPDLPVIMLSTYSDAGVVNEAIERGASGYVLKEASISQLREAIDIALGGRGLYLHPGVTMALADRRKTRPDDYGLSDREQSILELLADGATNEEIGSALFLSEKTVKSHLSSVFRKLGVENRTRAASKAIRENLVASSV